MRDVLRDCFRAEARVFMPLCGLVTEWASNSFYIHLRTSRGFNSEWFVPGYKAVLVHESIKFGACLWSKREDIFDERKWCLLGTDAAARILFLESEPKAF